MLEGREGWQPAGLMPLGPHSKHSRGRLSAGCRVRKKGVDFKQPPVSPPSATAQQRLMVVAMGHIDDDYEVWTHRDAAHTYEKRRGHTPR